MRTIELGFWVGLASQDRGYQFGFRIVESDEMVFVIGNDNFAFRVQTEMFGGGGRFEGMTVAGTKLSGACYGEDLPSVRTTLRAFPRRSRT